MIKLIHENPFRIIGVLANVSQKDLLKQQNKIKAFLKVGKAISSAYDFHFLTSIERNEANVNQALSDIQLNADKVFYSLFWFVNINGIDRIIIDNLVEGEEDHTNIDILEEITESGPPTPGIFSSFNNLGTFLLSSEDQSQIKKGVRLKLALIESESFNEYLFAITGNSNYRTNPNDVAKKFCSALLDEFKHEYSLEELSELFIGSAPVIRKYVVHKILEQPIRDIEKLVENTKEDREENPFEANEYGNELYQNSLATLQQIKAIVSEDDLRYKNLADEVATEILQCAIDYFNENDEHNNDLSICFKTAQNLVDKSSILATQEKTKTKIKKNAEILKNRKDQELNDAIIFLRSIKATYEEACNTIDNQVSEAILTMGYNQSINYNKVDRLKANCLNWDKVVDTISSNITENEVMVIQSSQDYNKVSEYKDLVNFLFDKLGPLQINKIKYICYWKDVRRTQVKSTAKKATEAAKKADEATNGCLEHIATYVVFFIILIIIIAIVSLFN